jgi:hypothetical protein
MSWLPNATVTVGGIDYTSETLWNVNIYYGRTSIWEQARAGYANIEILNTDDTHNLWAINNTVIIKLKDSSGVDITVFTGLLTEINNQVSQSGEIGTVIKQTLTAVAPFAFMARKVVGTSAYPKEYDDDRMLAILTECGVDIDVVDTPGVYEFTSHAANPTDGYTQAAYFAQMGFGYIYETTDGKVGYANESHRLNEVQDFGYFDIPLSYILSAGVSSNETLNDVTNDVLLSYKSNATVTATDATSIAAFGLQAASIQTELENMSEAQYQADRYVTLRANPQTNLSSFTIQLNSGFLTNADIDIFLNIYMGKPIQIQDLPNPIIHNTYQGFVEGWNLSFNKYEAALTLTSTDSTYSITPTRWQDVSPTQRWSDVGATIRWFEYE